ncbi:hypothetical protein ACC719_11630 [Rhizobium ruizarguesonis]
MFDVDPGQIEALDSKELVLLLGRLLHAEALNAGVELGGISVPLQITVPDGGEDGRITWQGGAEHTEYLPVRTNFFQCKASKIGRTGWKKECWVKSTQRKGRVRTITPALGAALGIGASYIGFTTEALTGPKRDDYIAGIREGIMEAGCDPDRLARVDIYDANKIAAWAARHPSVAIWLSETAHKQSLAGFRTVQGWGTSADFVDNAFVEDEEGRFAIGPRHERDVTGADNRTTSRTAWARILDHVAVPGRIARVVGSSGLGKSRFVFESLSSSKSQLSNIFNNSTVFADYRVVAASLLPTASRLAETGAPVLLVIDECPRDIAIELGRIAGISTSSLRVITIDTDDRPLEENSALHVSLERSGGALVEAIIRNKNSNIDGSTVGRLQDICGGYPRFAVLAASNTELRPSDFETTADIVDRILTGANITSDEELRALECLSLFENVAIEGEDVPQLDLVARELGRMSGDQMYEHLAKAIRHGLVGRNGVELATQPLPIALHLALRRLDVVRPSLLLKFMEQVPDALTMSLLRQWRHLDTSPAAIDVATRLLRMDGVLGALEVILSHRGSAMIDALVHIVPDRVADLLSFRFLRFDFTATSMDQHTRRNLVEALSKLVFRSRSFMLAARLLLRLAARETEEYENNATGVFKQLFHVYLSGTEVPPADRLTILDEGLASEDPATKAVCVEALSSIYEPDVIRFGDTDQIGSGPPLKDWVPATADEIKGFYRQGLVRLSELRRLDEETASRCERILALSTRQLLNTDLYKEFGEILKEIANEKEIWPEAVENVGNWLYFDRDEATEEQSSYARELYSELFPIDLIDRAIVFTKFWTSDIRNPDARSSDGETDFGYSEREARKVAEQISADLPLALRAVRRMTLLDLKTVQPFAEQLALGSNDKQTVFQAAVETYAEKGGSIAMLRGLLRGIDQRDRALADACVMQAISILGDKAARVDFYSVLAMSDERLDVLLDDLKSGRMPPSHTAYLSYGRGLDDLDPSRVGLLLDELARHGRDGAWTALEVAMMYRYGQPLPDVHVQRIARLLVVPELFERTTAQRRDAQIFEELVGKVIGAIGADESLADGLAAQVVRLAEGDDNELMNTLAGAMRRVVALLRDAAPAILWQHVCRFYDTATPIEVNRLKRLIGANSFRFDGKGPTTAGPVYGVPEQMVLEWADASENRPELLVDFYPILSASGALPTWHPALEEIAARYGKRESFRKALTRRIRPSAWSGSVVPLLEIFLKPLESWFDHSVRPLARWAREEHRGLERRIESEKEQEGQ